MKKQPNILLLAIQNYISYISIAILCCAIIGLSIFWVSVSELSEASKQAECAKLNDASNTLEKQFQLLEAIRGDICITVLYSPTQLFSSPQSSFAYREIELLEHFSGYKAYSPLCTNYFIYYLNTNYVYSNTAKVTFDRFFSAPWNDLFIDDSQISELKAYFNSIQTSSHGILMHVKNDNFLIVYPLRLTYSTIHPNAVLGFIINKNDLMELIAPTSEYFAGDISIYYFDSLMYGNSQLPDNTFVWKDNISYHGADILARSSEGYFVIHDEISPNTWNTALQSYRSFTYLFLAISIIVVAFLIISFAYKNYLPLHRASKKIQAMLPDAKIGNKSQIKQIEAAISIVHQKSKADCQQIQMQTDLLKIQESQLRDQELMLVLSGNAAWLSQSQLNEVGIDLSGSFFRVYVLIFEDQIPNSILNEIEMLSDEDQHYYPVKVSENEVAVISSFFLEKNANDGSMYLQELAVSHGKSLFTVSSSLTVDCLEKLIASYYSAKSITNDTNETQERRPVIDEAHEDYTHYLLLLLKSLRDGNTHDAHSYLSLLTDYISRKCESCLIQKYVLADVVSQLSRFSQSINMPIDMPEIGATLVLRDTDSVFRDLQAIVDRLLAQIQLQNEKAEGDVALQIKAYIDTNAFDYNCSLQAISSHFKLSPKQINAYLKEVTGLGYKDYEVSIRIKRAHTLLSDLSISVASISEQIGYTDVSSFIKAFKKITGLTPAEYRKKYYSTGCK